MITAWLVGTMETKMSKPYVFLSSTKSVWEAVGDIYYDILNSFQIIGVKLNLCHTNRDVTAY